LRCEWLEDRCLLSSGLLATAPVLAAPPALSAAAAVVNEVPPDTAPAAVAGGPVAAPPAAAAAPDSGGIPATAFPLNNLTASGTVSAGPARVGTAVTSSDNSRAVVDALTGALGQAVPVVGRVGQTPADTPLDAVPTQSAAAGASLAAPAPLGGGSLLDLSVAADLSLGGSTGSSVQLGARAGLLGDPAVSVSAGAGVGQNGAVVGLAVTAGSAQPDGTGLGVGANAVVDLGGSQLVTLGAIADVQPSSSGSTGGVGVTLAVGDPGVEVGAGLPLGGTGPVSPGPSSGGPLLGGDLFVSVGDQPVVSVPTVTGQPPAVSLPPVVSVGDQPVVSVPTVTGQPPAVSVPPVAGDTPGHGAGGCSAAGQVPPFAPAPPVAAVGAETPPATGRPATPVVATGGPPVAEPAADEPPAVTAADAFFADPAAGEPPAATAADAFFADLPLWGAADDVGWIDGLVPELPAPVATPKLLAGPDTAAPEVLLPGGLVLLPESQDAGLLTACVPYDVQSLDAAFNRLLDQLRSLGWDLSSLLARLSGTPWVVALAAMAVTCEAYRRRLGRARDRLALAGGAAGTLTWFPSLSTPGPGDEG
jgi:hypothetical protein